MDLKRLFLTWIALMVLLGATTVASMLPIGMWRQVINLMIAGAKAAFILAIFMKLRSETLLVRLSFGASGVLLAVFATMLTADYHLRPAPPTGQRPPVAGLP
jgi:caa(3)-type oxidase subunit IV